MNIVATTGEVIAGVDDIKYISPLKLAQIKALGSDLIIGTDNVKYITALALRSLKASIAESQAAIDDIKYVTPAGLGAWAQANPGVIPGSVMYFAGNTVPTGYLEANGALVSRTTYSDLFAAIGTIYGAGDGSTTFKLPDLRAEFIRG